MGKVAQLQETERAGPLLFSRAPAQSLPSMRRSSAKEGRFSFLANHTLLIYKHTYTPAVQQVSLLASKESRRCCWSATGFLLVCWLAAGQQKGHSKPQSPHPGQPSPRRSSLAVSLGGKCCEGTGFNNAASINRHPPKLHPTSHRAAFFRGR